MGDLDRRARKELGVNPGDSLGDPAFHPIDLFGMGFANVSIGPNPLAEDGPALEVSRLRLPQLLVEGIDLPHDGRQRKLIGSELEPAVDVPLLEIAILEQTVKPKIILPGGQGPVPTLRFPSLEIIRVAER